MKKIFVINGSASENSVNEKLVTYIEKRTKEFFEVDIFSSLKSLPHFDPQLSVDGTPLAVMDFRQRIENADGIIFCTPEYVFSIPSGLKNAIEWCVATTVFSEKPVGIITASASGVKGHEELQLIMKTLYSKFTIDTTLLIQGVKGKINEQGEITHSETREQLGKFLKAYRELAEGYLERIENISNVSKQ